jgi:hypothetical protein
MTRTRAWRTATAGAAVAALLTVTAGPAAAQLPELPSDPSQLQSALEELDPAALEQLLDQLGLPSGTPLDQVAQAVQADADDEVEGDPAGGDPGPVPEAGLGGFAGYAAAEGATVFVALPDELAEGLAPVLEGLGIAGSVDADGTTRSGIRIDLAQVQADLERAAAGEEVSSSASALITNAILGSAEADSPGACAGGPMEVALPPDAETPLLTLTVLGIDCEETDERAFADVQIAGLDIRLAALLELGLPQEVADGASQLVAELNDALLAPVSSGSCQAIDPILAVALPGAAPCEDGQPLLQLRDPFDLDVPVVDLDAVGATGEVVHADGTLTATATSTFTGLNVLGVACVGGDAPPLRSTSTATSDGSTASRDASAPSLALGLCGSEQSLLRVLLGDGPLGDVAVFEQVVQQRAFDGELQAVFDGVDQLLTALSTEAITQGRPVLGDIEGAGTSARTEPFVVASTVPLSGLPGLGETPLGDLGVIVVGGATEVGVNALPADAEPPAPSTQEPVTPAPADLPRTGAGAGALVGLAALGAAAALRRRDG